MTTTPNPQTVREIAEEVANIALRDSVHVDQWISAVVNSRFGNECSQFRAPLHAAVARRMATVKPSWPAEQPQAFECEVCTKPITAYPCVLCGHEPDPWKDPAEQPQDDGDAPADLYWPFTGGLDVCYGNHDNDGAGYRECCMRAGLAYVLKLHEQQIRASLATERDGDVRAVAALLAAEHWDVIGEAKARTALRDRFTDRIAALDARDAKGGEQR